MKRLLMLVGFAAAVYGFTLQGAMQVTLYQDVDHFSYSNGGEFRATPNADLSWVVANYSPLARNALGLGGFQTFCIETSEYFSPGVTYNATISEHAMYGRQPTGGDHISIGTAWLYSQFAAGALTGYDYSYGLGRVADGSSPKRPVKRS